MVNSLRAMAPMQSSLTKTQENLQKRTAAYNELAARNARVAEELTLAREEAEKYKAQLAEMEALRDEERKKRKEAAIVAHRRKTALVTLFHYKKRHLL